MSLQTTQTEDRTSISVIIPTCNEAALIGRAVGGVRRLDRLAQIIVVDGESRDGTRALAARAGAEVICSERGRGIQCHAGAMRAGGDILIFLHADTQLPEDAFRVVREAFADPEVRIGTFRLRFDRDNWLLRLYAFFTRWDSVLTRFGDQCIVVRRSFYDALGGFPGWQKCEDVHFLRVARRHARIHTFPAAVTTSSRRFDRDGLVRIQLRNLLAISKYLMGVKE